MKNKVIYLSSLLCFVPILIGLLLYSQLPQQIPTHFNSQRIDGYTAKSIAVFGIPFYSYF